MQIEEQTKVMEDLVKEDYPKDLYSLKFWNQFMGRNLPQSESQPLQPVIIESGKLKIRADTLRDRFSQGTKIGFQRHGNHIFLTDLSDGITVEKDETHELELPEAIQNILPKEEQFFGMVVNYNGHLEFMPIRVQEHEPDVLGPRIIDELQEPTDETQPFTIVRHIVKSFEYEDLTNERLQELEYLICSKSFSYDPLKELMTGNDWIAWKVRNEILQQPDAENQKNFTFDQTFLKFDDEKLRQEMMNKVFAGQIKNGSWNNSVVKTAYGILRALSIHVPSNDERIQKAAQWLLDWPEPAGRPGMWMLDEERLQKWDANKKGLSEVDWLTFMLTNFTEEDHDLFRGQEHQEVIPSCTRMHAGCDAMLHASATVADALCCCGHANHPRVKAYANSILQLGGMFGYFCACWGILDAEEEIEDLRGKVPDFNQRTDEHEIALKSVPYGYARDEIDLLVLARNPNYPGIHRPDLSDTNGWVPYRWKEIGLENHFALVGSYWQNADCWAKTNLALSQFPTWSGSIAEFFALFQCHLYQTPLGEWNQGYPAGIFRLIAEVTRITRARHDVEAPSISRFAKMLLLKTIPWLREHQKEDGLWAHDELAGMGEHHRPLDRRLGTYHIVSVLNEFNLLEKLHPDVG